MKAKDVLKITCITRNHLYRLVKQGKIRASLQPNGRYDYNPEDVYKYVGKKRLNLHTSFMRGYRLKKARETRNRGAK
jgi:predicted site-specific integrase-resolvase